MRSSVAFAVLINMIVYPFEVKGGHQARLMLEAIAVHSIVFIYAHTLFAPNMPRRVSIVRTAIVEAISRAVSRGFLCRFAFDDFKQAFMPLCSQLFKLAPVQAPARYAGRLFVKGDDLL
jgi:hypothetical protein